MFTKTSERLTLTGAILITIGAFAPMIALSRLGTVSYADASNGVYLLLLAAIAAAALIVVKLEKFSPYAVLATWVILLWPVLKNIGSGGQKDDGGLLGKIGKATKTVTDPLTDVTARFFTNITNFEWGGYVFLIGLIALTAGGVMLFLESRKA